MRRYRKNPQGLPCGTSAEVNTYKNWSAEFKVQELEEAYNTFYKSLLKNNHINIEALTIEEAKELRFSKWDEESDLYLFPLWLVPLIPEGMEVTSINGETFKYSKENTNNDIRFGCVAYGINLIK